MTRPRPSLYLITPLLEDPASILPGLEEACRAASVTAVLLRLAPADERSLIKNIKLVAPIVQAQDAALILDDPGPDFDLATLVTRGGADGAHAEDPERLTDLCQRLKEGRNVGAGGLLTKHDAMLAGEIGVDYVMFGEAGRDGHVPPRGLVLERVAWWVEIFQTPCVAYAPTLAELPALAAAGPEFVALGDAVWSHPAGPGAALAQAAEMLSQAPESTA